MRVSYLIRHRSGSLYFRYVFPPHLRPLLGREVRISLGLALRSEALPIAFHLSSKTPQLIAQIMNEKISSIPESQLRVWVRDMLKREMRKAYLEHCTRRIPLSSEGLESRLDDVIGIQEECSISLVKGGYFPAEESSRDLLREHGLESDAIEYHVPLCSRVMMQEHDGYAGFMRKLYTDPYCKESDIDAVYADAIVQQASDGDMSSVSVTRREGSVEPVGDTLQRYIEYKVGRKDWNQKSSVTNPIILRRFGDVVYGNRCIRDISVYDVNIDVMSAYVSSLFKIGLSGKTIQNNFVVVKTFIRWCEEEGFVESAGKLNKRLVLSAKGKKEVKKKKRTIFTNEDLRMLFISPQYLNNKHRFSWQFWAPLIGLLSGARLEEIIQMYVEDIKNIGGVWCFDINGEGEKSVKTVASNRLIPIHPLLLNIGLLNRVEMLKNDGHVELFPTIQRNPKTGVKSDNVSKWFTRYRRKCGVADKDILGINRVFHSFRHTVVTYFRSHGVEERYVQAVIGHESEKTVTDMYDSNEITMRTLLDKAINILEFDCLRVEELKRNRVIFFP